MRPKRVRAASGSVATSPAPFGRQEPSPARTPAARTAGAAVPKRVVMEEKNGTRRAGYPVQTVYGADPGRSPAHRAGLVFRRVRHPRLGEPLPPQLARIAPAARPAGGV